MLARNAQRIAFYPPKPESNQASERSPKERRKVYGNNKDFTVYTHKYQSLAVTPSSYFHFSFPSPQRAAYAGFMPAATCTSAGATNPVGVAKFWSASDTSAQAATRAASGLALITAR